jgi:hypothetical protein
MSESVYALGDLPIIQLEKYLKQQGDYSAECKTVVECLYKYGILIVRDPVKFKISHNDY